MIKDGNTRITITLSDDLLERLDEYCACRAISRTNYIRELIEKNIDLDICNLENARRSFENFRNHEVMTL